MIKQYSIYILTNRNNTVLYTGVTGNLQQRIYQHKNGLVEGFTKRYNVTKLVYYEYTNDIKSAILREKQIKAGSREKKISLIEKFNPHWEDLYWNSISVCSNKTCHRILEQDLSLRGGTTKQSIPCRRRLVDIATVNTETDTKQFSVLRAIRRKGTGSNSSLVLRSRSGELQYARSDKKPTRQHQCAPVMSSSMLC